MRRCLTAEGERIRRAAGRPGPWPRLHSPTNGETDAGEQHKSSRHRRRVKKGSRRGSAGWQSCLGDELLTDSVKRQTNFA